MDAATRVGEGVCGGGGWERGRRCASAAVRPPSVLSPAHARIEPPVSSKVAGSCLIRHRTRNRVTKRVITWGRGGGRYASSSCVSRFLRNTFSISDAL